MKTLIKSLVMLSLLAGPILAPMAANAQSFAIDLPRLTWPTESVPVAKGCNDAASLTAPTCAPGQ